MQARFLFQVAVAAASFLLSAGLRVCAQPITLIDAIQGEAMASPMAEQVVTIEGIVVGDFQGRHPSNGADLINGFFVQEETEDEDGNPATSSGIYVYLKDREDDATPVSVGDLVRVTGKVVEFHDLTELTNVESVEVLDIGQPLPPAARISFPLPGGQTYLERYEGMRVVIEEPLFVTEVYHLGRGSKVVLSAGRPQMQPTQLVPPGERAAALQAHNDAMRIALDDGSFEQNPYPVLFARRGKPLGPENTLRWGDSVELLEGVLTYSFGGYRSDPNDYRILLAGPVVFNEGNPRPAEPAVPSGDLRVATFNVLNFFNGPEFPTPRGAESAELLALQQDKIVHAMALLDADLIALNEIENDGFGPESAIGQLAQALNVFIGKDAYVAVDPGSSSLGTDEITVGLLYRKDRLILRDTATLDSIQPLNRVPLMGLFEIQSNGQRFAAVANHLKSKSSPTKLPQDLDQGDGQGNSNYTRTVAAQQLLKWLKDNPAGMDVSNILILGDMNAYAMEDPIRTLTDGGFISLAHAFATSDGIHSYVFNGQAGTLDYIFASPSMREAAMGAAIWHINAAEPSVLEYRSAKRNSAWYASTPYRSSDHDPVVAVFSWQ